MHYIPKHFDRTAVGRFFHTVKFERILLKYSIREIILIVSLIQVQGLCPNRQLRIEQMLCLGKQKCYSILRAHKLHWH